MASCMILTIYNHLNFQILVEKETKPFVACIQLDTLKFDSSLHNVSKPVRYSLDISAFEMAFSFFDLVVPGFLLPPHGAEGQVILFSGRYSQLHTDCLALKDSYMIPDRLTVKRKSLKLSFNGCCKMKNNMKFNIFQL